MTTPIDRPAVEAWFVRLRSWFVSRDKERGKAAELMSRLLAALEAQQATIAALRDRLEVSDAAHKTKTFMISDLRAELAKVTAERDEAIAAKKAKHKEMFEATNYYEDLIREIEAERDEARASLAKAVEAEREACAKVVEGWHVLRNGDMTIAKLAAAIRARKEPTP